MKLFSASRCSALPKHAVVAFSEAGLEKRKGNPPTITETTTSTATNTVSITVTIHTTTELYFTKTITFFQPTTITNNITTTASSVFSTTDLSTTTIPSASDDTIHDHATATDRTLKSSITSHATPLPASSSAAALSVDRSPSRSLSVTAILGIVFGVLGLLALVVGIWLLIRRFYRMYRRERVARKQAQTEGNDLPSGEGISLDPQGTGQTGRTVEMGDIGMDSRGKRSTAHSDMSTWSKGWK